MDNDDMRRNKPTNHKVCTRLPCAELQLGEGWGLGWGDAALPNKTDLKPISLGAGCCTYTWMVCWPFILTQMPEGLSQYPHSAFLTQQSPN